MDTPIDLAGESLPFWINGFVFLLIFAWRSSLSREYYRVLYSSTIAQTSLGLVKEEIFRNKNTKKSLVSCLEKVLPRQYPQAKCLMTKFKKLCLFWQFNFYRFLCIFQRRTLMQWEILLYMLFFLNSEQLCNFLQGKYSSEALHAMVCSVINKFQNISLLSWRVSPFPLSEVSEREKETVLLSFQRSNVDIWSCQTDTDSGFWSGQAPVPTRAESCLQLGHTPMISPLSGQQNSTNVVLHRTRKEPESRKRYSGLSFRQTND